MTDYFSLLIIVKGDSKYDFHELENLATVAPSTTRLSADHETLMTVRGATTALPL